MASSYTENYGLCQWEATDSFVRTEFNQDNARIDAALKDLSDTVELKCRMKTGTYTGNGTDYRDSQTIDVGFPIQAVLVENRAGNRSQAVNAATLGGLALKGTSLYNDETLVSISGSSFTVYVGGQYKGNLNREGTTYLYVAWG